MHSISYYDLRHVTGEVTHIDIDNGVVESAGTSFFSKAVLRVLVKTGWGVLQIDNFTPCTGKNLTNSWNGQPGLLLSQKSGLCSGMYPGGSFRSRH